MASVGESLPGPGEVGGFRQRLELLRPRRRRLAALVALLAIASVGSFTWFVVTATNDWPFPEGAEGRWVTEVIVVDGEPLDFEGSLTIGDGSATVERPCNSLTIERRGGVRLSTMRGCLPDGFDREAADVALTEAIEAGGRIEGDQLVFESARVELRYRRVGD